MKKFRVALLQLLPSDDASGNLEKGIRYCRQAKEAGADMALFPEMWNIGYDFTLMEKDAVKWAANAIDADSSFIRGFRGLAKELKMAVGISYLEKWPGKPRNTVSIIDYLGNCVLTYAKVHTCDFDKEQCLTGGDDFYAADLQTENGKIKIGAMICFDREFPESARILMLKGAEIILVPNACPMEINRKTQLRARAFENMVGVALANYAYGKNDCNGHSLAYDGMAYGEIRPGKVESRDTLVVEAGEAEGVYLAEFDMELLRDYRKREVWGNAWRKPKTYSLLAADNSIAKMP